MLLGGTALTWTRPPDPIVLTPNLDAEDRLETVVGALYDDPDPLAAPTLASAATARAMPFITRIASLCAVSRGEFTHYTVDDLRYAERVWAFAQRSADELFGGFSGSPMVDALVADLVALYADPHDVPWMPDTANSVKPYGVVAVNEAVSLGLVIRHKVYRVDGDGNRVAGRPRKVLMLAPAAAARYGLSHRTLPADEIV